jgi:hypothetical protein
MAENSLYPAFVQLTYASLYGAHQMRIPTRAWDAAMGTHGEGGYHDWATDADVDAYAMVVALVTEMIVHFPTTVTFSLFTIYTLDAPDAPARPRISSGLALAGTDALAGWAQATQKTFTFYDTEYSIVKLVLLDFASNGVFPKHIGGTLATEENDLGNEFVADTNAWSSRNGQRPATLLSTTCTLNEKLRREYGLT